MMSTTNCRKFKGELENYLRNTQNNIESRFDNAGTGLDNDPKGCRLWYCARLCYI